LTDQGVGGAGAQYRQQLLPRVGGGSVGARRRYIGQTQQVGEAAPAVGPRQVLFEAFEFDQPGFGQGFDVFRLERRTRQGGGLGGGDEGPAGVVVARLQRGQVVGEAGVPVELEIGHGGWSAETLPPTRERHSRSCPARGADAV